MSGPWHDDVHVSAPCHTLNQHCLNLRLYVDIGNYISILLSSWNVPTVLRIVAPTT